MSLFVLRSKGLVIAEHETELEIPVKFVLHRPANDGEGFKISLYQKSWVLGCKEDPSSNNSDIPFCTWMPDGRGCISISHRFTWYRDAGLVPQLQELCEQMYEAWKEGSDA